MSDHVHDWAVMGKETGGVWAKCMGCEDRLSWGAVSRRLNATEMLSAGDAESFAGIAEGEGVEAEELYAYAAALEGK